VKTGLKTFFPMTKQPLVGHSNLSIEASQSHSDTQILGGTPLDE